MSEIDTAMDVGIIRRLEYVSKHLRAASSCGPRERSDYPTAVNQRCTITARLAAEGQVQTRTGYWGRLSELLTPCTAILIED